MPAPTSDQYDARRRNASRRGRKFRAQSLGTMETRYSEAGALAINPNRGKRRTPLALRLPASEEATIRARESAKQYAPLTVSNVTLDKRGRRNPRYRTSYTI